ncbi:hypothetical protein ABPG74_020306 [Tetrahymena malaccensis]
MAETSEQYVKDLKAEILTQTSIYNKLVEEHQKIKKVVDSLIDENEYFLKHIKDVQDDYDKISVVEKLYQREVNKLKMNKKNLSLQVEKLNEEVLNLKENAEELNLKIARLIITNRQLKENNDILQAQIDFLEYCKTRMKQINQRKNVKESLKKKKSSSKDTTDADTQTTLKQVIKRVDALESSYEDLKSEFQDLKSQVVTLKEETQVLFKNQKYIDLRIQQLEQKMLDGRKQTFRTELYAQIYKFIGKTIKDESPHLIWNSDAAEHQVKKQNIIALLKEMKLEIRDLNIIYQEKIVRNLEQHPDNDLILKNESLFIEETSFGEKKESVKIYENLFNYLKDNQVAIQNAIKI